MATWILSKNLHKNTQLSTFYTAIIKTANLKKGIVKVFSLCYKFSVNAMFSWIKFQSIGVSLFEKIKRIPVCSGIFLAEHGIY